MRSLLKLIAVWLLVSTFLSGQEGQQSASPAPAEQPAGKSEPASSAPQSPPAAKSDQPAAKPQEPPKFYQPEGPDPTAIIAHEHSVTDMLDVVPFTSQIFHNTRMLRIFLPGNYFSPHNRNRRYPVLYLQDGQNVFDKATSFSGKEWEADETVDHLVSAFKITPMFIVGIDNAGEQRASEYLSYPDAHNPQFQSANPPELDGTKYADFLTKEVMPFLQKRYRIAIGPANTGLGGSSYGAVVALTTALHRPGIFGKLLLESPSLWVGDGKLVTEVEKTKLLPQKIYLGIGTKEAGNAESDALILKTFDDVEEILKKKGMGPTRLKVVVEEGGLHNEEAWARRFPDALLFLYGR
jgi:predicted alpha/beta superfamily hydrolase